MSFTRLIPKTLAALISKFLLNFMFKKQKAAIKDRGIAISKEKMLERIIFSINMLKL